MNALTTEEFAMLAGTETAIKMMRNRIRYTLSSDEYMTVCDTVKNIATGFYHFKTTINMDLYEVLMYFENPQDLSHIEQIIYMARKSEEYL